jgi:hypothetical protein
MASGSESDGGHVGGGVSNLIPHKNKFKTLVPAFDETRLHQSYNIPNLVKLHFQELGELSITRGDVVRLNGC